MIVDFAELIEEFDPQDVTVEVYGDYVLDAGTNDYVPSNETQRVTLPSPTGGTFTLSFGGGTTAGLAYNATAAQVATALAALAALDAADLTVTGANGGPYTVVFGGKYAANGVAQLTATSNLTGGTGSIVIKTIDPATYTIRAVVMPYVGFNSLSSQSFSGVRFEDLSVEGSNPRFYFTVGQPTDIATDVVVPIRTAQHEQRATVFVDGIDRFVPQKIMDFSHHGNFKAIICVEQRDEPL